MADPLQRYRDKRNFQITAEPAEGGAPSEGLPVFVNTQGTTDTADDVYNNVGGTGFSEVSRREANFKEFFLGDSPKPRIAVGIGVNWNSPFGPFRIDFAKVLMKQPGDDTKSFTFNVGTQF